MRRVLKIFFLLLIILIGAAVLSINPIVEYVVEELVNEENAKTQYNFTIRYDELKVNLFTGDLRLIGFSFQPDSMSSSEWDSLLRSVPRATAIQMEELRFDNVDLIHFIRTEELRMDTLVFDEPRVEVMLMLGTADSASKISTGNFISEAHFHNIAVHNAEITVTDMQDSTEIFRLGNFSTELSDIRLDSAMVREGKIFDYAEMVYTLEDVKSHINEQQTMKFSKLYINARDQLIEAENVSLEFRGDKKEWVEAQPNKKDLLTLNLPGFRIEGFDLPEYQRSNTLIMQKVSLIDAHLSIFNCDYKERPPGSKPFFPVEKLFKLKFPLQVEELVIKNARIDVDILSKEKDEPGNLFISGLSGTLRNVSNLSKEGFMELDAVGLLMGKGRLEAQVDMSKDNRKLEIRGSLAMFDLHEFNHLVEPALNVKIHSGYLNKLDFHMRGSNDHQTGIVAMDYKDLNIKIYKKEGDVEQDIGRNRVLGFLVNTIIKNENIRGANHFRYGEIHYDRDARTGFFSVLWKAVATGAGHTLEGLGHKERHARKWMEENNFSLPD